jgi:serine/threonine-protein kinase HipA
MKLQVFQYDRNVGILEGTANQGITFTYDNVYVGDSSARPLSHSLPLSKDPFPAQKCLPFFTGLLPDGEMKRSISAFLHVSESSSLKLLEALGGECAGTVSLYSDEERANGISGSDEKKKAVYRKIEIADLSKMIGEMDMRPLLIASSGLRLSLAGAQQKIPLARFDGIWHLPLGGAPSTHILKPSRHPFPDLAVNEYACMQAAVKCGLPVPKTELLHLNDTPILVIARYDRDFDGAYPHRIRRLHQEDSCQALAIMPDRKYEADGGPGFAEIVNLINELSRAPILDVRNLLSLAIFNFLIGNCDAHGKNISFLYPVSGGASLAPFYDLVSTTAYGNLTTKLSMKLGGEYRIENISRTHFLKLAETTGVGSHFMNSLIGSISEKLFAAFSEIREEDAFRPNAELVDRIRAGIDSRIAQLR